MAEEACRQSGQFKWYEMAVKLHDRIGKAKGLIPNVDFYSAPLFYSLGIPVDLFTPVIAAGRVAGWTANIIEQHDDNRLIRPRADYVGPTGAGLGAARPALSDGQEPHAQAHRAAPRRRQAHSRRGDRDLRRPGAAHRHQRDHGPAPVRGHGAFAGGAPASGGLRRPQRLPGRLAQLRRPPVHADSRATLRRCLLQARQRHLPPGAPGELLHSRGSAARYRQPHAAVRRGRHARHRRRRSRRGGGPGGRRVLPHHARRGPRMAHRHALPLGDGEGRHPRAAAPAQRARRQRQDLRVRGPRGWPALLARPAHDHRQHGRRADLDHERLPERRA